MSKVGVVGLGYVGLPLAVASQLAGHKVYGIDLDSEKIRNLVSGVSYIQDVTEDELSKALADGFHPSTDFSILKEVEIVLLCVPTPLRSDLQPDLTFLTQAMTNVTQYVKEGTLVINESTSYPGTVRDLLPQIAFEVDRAKLLHFAVAPERIDPGNSSWGFRNTPRLVGAVNHEAFKRAQEFYSSFCSSIYKVSSPEVAELAKLLENSYRLVNIALINEITKLASNLNIPILEVIEAASTKPYGFQPFFPGLGVGGHCIPVDPVYLTDWAIQNNSRLPLVEISLEINRKMPEFVCAKVSHLREKFNSEILILGVAYKSGIADTREAPALALIENLTVEGWKVEWWDPLVTQLPGLQRAIDTGKKYQCVIVSNKVYDEWAITKIKEANYVFDCTGQFADFSNVQTW